MSTDIRSAFETIMAVPGNQAIAADYLANRLADAKRMTTRINAESAYDRAYLENNKRTPSAPLADRAASVAPIRPHVMAVASDDTSDVWQAIADVLATGFVFPTDDGTRSIPFNPVAMRRAMDAAHREGREFHIDRLDDMISDATERAYVMLSELAATADPANAYSHDGSAHAPVGMIAGWDVVRAVRCGKCGPCDHAGSRYVVGGCLAPTTIVEFTDAQRCVSRALYAAASASASSERYSRVTTDGVMPESVTTDDTYRDCGHGATCDLDTCRMLNVIRAARIACEALGLPTVADNGRASVDFLSFVAVAYGQIPSEGGRLRAGQRIRSTLGSLREASLTMAQ